MIIAWVIILRRRWWSHSNWVIFSILLSICMSICELVLWTLNIKWIFSTDFGWGHVFSRFNHLNFGCVPIFNRIQLNRTFIPSQNISWVAYPKAMDCVANHVQNKLSNGVHRPRHTKWLFTAITDAPSLFRP